MNKANAVQMVVDSETRLSRRIGYVQFAHPREADGAVYRAHGRVRTQMKADRGLRNDEWNDQVLKGSVIRCGLTPYSPSSSRRGDMPTHRR